MHNKIIHAAFEEQAGRAPDNLAVKAAGQSVTYGELNAAANRLARLLGSCNVAKESVVAVALPPGTPLVLSVLAVFKAGGVYMPLHLRASERRLSQMLTEPRPALLVTDAAQHELALNLIKARDLPVQYLLVVDEQNNCTAYAREADAFVRRPGDSLSFPGTNPGPSAEPGDSSYLFYTAGPTGRAKAVVGTHKGLAHYVHWQLKEFGTGAHEQVSLLNPVTLDASLRDMFVPLAAGGTLHIPAEAERTSPALLASWLTVSGITLVHCVPALVRQLSRHLDSQPGRRHHLKPLRLVLVAGDTLYGRDVQHWRDVVGTHAELVNLYGPVETTLSKTFYRIGALAGDLSRPVPVGGPIDNTAVVVINGSGPCKLGEVGEVYLKTPYWTKGYLNDEALNRTRFVQNPLVADRGDVVYRTGDLGRYLPGRVIELAGRTDGQVMRNGERVELEEIERAVREVKGIDQALATAHANADGEWVLTCYYTSPGKIRESVVRAHLGGLLENYSMPRYLFALEAFRLTADGKPDRAALPRPEELFREQHAYEPPANDTERRLESLWEDVLGRKDIGRKTPFFGLGASSLHALQVVARVYREFGVNLQLRDLYDHPTVAALAAVIATARRVAYQKIVPVPKRTYYDASHAQKRIWVLTQLEESRHVFNLPSAYRLAGRMDHAALQRALDALVSRHESLRTTFLLVGDQLKQQVHEPGDLPAGLTCVDLRGDAGREEKALAAAAEEISRPFDLVRGPLLRARLLRLADEQYVFLLTLHHLVADGWSMNVLIHELLGLYSAFNAGRESDLAPLPVQYRDYTAWLNGQLSGDLLREHQHYWWGVFAQEVTPLQLPGDFQRPAVKTFAGMNLTYALDEQRTARLLHLTESSRVSLFTTLVALVNLLLYRYTGQKDIVVGTDLAGRHHNDLEDQIGLYLNTVALRSRVDSEAPFSGFLQQVKQGVLGAHDHQMYPFDRLVDELRLVRDPSRSPLFDVFILLQNLEVRRTVRDLAGIRVSGFGPEMQVSKFDLTFRFFEAEGQLILTIEFNTHLFKPATIDQLKENFFHLVDTVTADVEAPIRHITLLATQGELVGLDAFAGPVQSTDFF